MVPIDLSHYVWYDVMFVKFSFQVYTQELFRLYRYVDNWSYHVLFVEKVRLFETPFKLYNLNAARKLKKK